MAINTKSADMYKKHITHLIIVSLKFFFDFDHNTCLQIFSMGRLLTCVLIMLFTISRDGLYDFLLTVRQDLCTFRADLQALSGRWSNSDLHELMGNRLNAIRTDFVEDSRNWRLKIENFRIVK